MTTRDTLRKGWCPGALRPMETGDGLLLRIRPRIGTLSISALRKIAHVASRYGSGHIDLTNRANVQLRGLTSQTYEAAIEELSRDGLIDSNVAVESIRNIVIDPLAGLDPLCLDVRPLAADLERSLEEQIDLHALPPKFGFEFTGYTTTSGHHGADICVAPYEAGGLAIQLDGDAHLLGLASYDAAVPAVLQIALQFVQSSKQDPALRRMRDAVAAVGAPEIFRRSGLAVQNRTELSSTKPQPNIGKLGPASSPFAIAIGLPFGRVTAAQLLGLCKGAANVGVTEARISRHRTLVFPTDSAPLAILLDQAAQAGLIIDDSDPRIGIDVCPGAPACRNATTETRKDAERLVLELQSSGISGVSLHISGCQKGCARASKADFTLVAHNGAYDIIADGSPDNVPFMLGIAPERLGLTVRSRLTGSRL